MIVDSYPADGARFFKREANEFANPVGSTISREIQPLFDELLNQNRPGELSCFLEPIMKIRAVQDFSPAQAVGFVFLLKKAIRENLEENISGHESLEELPGIESRIDQLALLAFDIYMRCREKLHEIRTNELKNRSYFLMERMNQMEKTRDESIPDK